jgi:hypothetical protein
LITGGWDQHVKRILVENRKVDKDFSQICVRLITRMKISADDEKLLVGDRGGHLKLISSRDGELIKDFGRVHEGDISGIMLTAD